MKHEYANWKIFSNIFLLLLIIVFIFSTCRNGEEVGFTRLALTASAENTAWENGDRIGIFTINSGAPLQSNSIFDHNSNLPFITNGNGVFQSQVKNVTLPADGAAIDVIAYYPFTTTITNYTIPIHIFTQTDFLYSNNLTGVSNNTAGDNELRFIRPLSKLEIHIAPKTSDIDLTHLTAVLRGAKTRATFSLADGTLTVDENSATDFPLTITHNSAGQRQISIWMLPQDASNDTDILFSVGNDSYTLKLPYPFEPGVAHVYVVDLELIDTGGDGGGDITPPPLYAYMEIPAPTSGELPPNTVEIRHKVGNRNWLNTTLPLPYGEIRNYTVLYDTESRYPLWVAYPLHPIYLKTGNRTDAWQFDPTISGTFQPVLLRGWRSQTGQSYDRGHNLPSADRNATQELNATTFFFTNFVAQNPSMNQGTWERLEAQVRNWSTSNPNDTIYVVTGNILYATPNFDPIDNNGVPSAKPEYMYKALLRLNMTTNTYTTIGFKMENRNNSAPYTQRIVSVRQLEEITGFTFFPTLPEDIAVSVKENTNMNAF